MKGKEDPKKGAINKNIITGKYILEKNIENLTTDGIWQKTISNYSRLREE